MVASGEPSASAEARTYETLFSTAKLSAIDFYCSDLTMLAVKKKLKPVLGRTREIDLIETIILRREKRNVLLVGDAGVGKTAIAEALALRIIKGEINESLRQCRVLSLDITALIAGAGIVGEVERRIKSLFLSIKEDDKVILFIDEIHMARGAGATSNSASDLIEHMKKPLSEGCLRVIAATTQEEYERFIMPNSAFSRRFQVIRIEEPGHNDLMDIMYASAADLARYHHLAISPEVVEYIVRVTGEYVINRRFPDKAIDVLTSACAFASKNGLHIVTLECAHVIMQEMYGISNSTPGAVPFDGIRDLERTLQSRIIGQDHVIQAVLPLIQRAHLGLLSHNGTRGVILLVGSTGVGKTELVRAIADNYPIRSDLVVFNMSEYIERHDSAKLFGSPPGYVGYEEGGKLANVLRRTPNAIILFDEIDKAHPDIFDSLLGLFDSGVVYDNHGAAVSGKNAMFFMTSNDSMLIRKSMGFVKNANVVISNQLSKSLETVFRSEFINRIDEICVFNHLNYNDLKIIARKELDEYLELINQKKIFVECNYPDLLVDFILSHVENESHGARPIRRIINKHIVSKVASAVAKGCAGKLKYILALVNGEPRVTMHSLSTGHALE